MCKYINVPFLKFIKFQVSAKVGECFTLQNKIQAFV